MPRTIRSKTLRKIATVVAALMLPVQAHALGVGEIEWDSALNQPLDAEIGLFALGSVNENDIRVKLAPYEAYQEAGIEYPAILRDLKFSVKSRSNGDYYIQVHSSEAVKAPFLDMLVQIDWPSGHLMREFTVLLDLPVMTDEAAAPVSAPVTATPGSSVSPTMGRTDVEPAPKGQVFGETASQQVSNELRVGMVKRGDTLWGIAEGMRRDPSVSVQQVMLALLKSNPEAFYNNNINNLKAGYVLRLDDPTLITEVSKEEAAREAQRQYQAWLAAKGGVKSSAAAASGRKSAAVGAGAEQGAGGPSLRLVAPDEADVGLAASAGGNGQARNFSDKNLASLRQELESALAASDAGRQENEQLRDRISELEEQISKMQRLLSLRDDALSVLQANPEAQQAQQQTAGVAATAPDNAPAETSTADEAPESAAAGSATTETQQAQDSTATGEDVAPAAALAQQQAKPGAGAQKPAPKQNPARPREQGFVATVMGNIKRTVSAAGSLLNPIALGGIVSAVLLLIGGAWFLRKRKISAEDLEQSMMVEVADKQLSEDLANGTVSDLEQKEETRAVELLDSTSNDNFEADIDEIDVLAEADVYLAYQRFDRAEELMREAVNNEPQRLDLRFKLLEVYAASGNRDGFIETAEAVKAHGGQEDAALWDKIVAMGTKIAPDYALFGAGAAAGAVADNTAEAADAGNDVEAEIPGGELEADFAGLDDDLMLDLDAHIAADAEAESPTAVGDTMTEMNADDALSGDSGVQQTALAEDAAKVAETDSVTTPEASDTGTQKDADQALDFDLGDVRMAADDTDAGADTGASGQGFVADNTLEYDALGGAGESAAATESTETTASETSIADDNSLDLDIELAGQDDAAAEVQGIDFESETVAADGGAETTAVDDTDDGLAFDMPETDSGNAAAPDSAEPPVATDTEAEAATDEDAFDLDSLDVASAGSIDDELTDDIDWLTGVADEAADDDSDTFFSSEDEVATKLDLIRAYIDMGDNESARNILTEVVEEGNDNQKQEAEELLRQMG
jgi:pilus assembly protein FimV